MSDQKRSVPPPNDSGYWADKQPPVPAWGSIEAQMAEEAIQRLIEAAPLYNGVLFEGLDMPSGCVCSETTHSCPILLHCHAGMEAVRQGKALDRRPEGCPAREIKNNTIIDVPQKKEGE